VTVIVVLICCCVCTDFYQNWFTCLASRRPQKLNVQCAVARQWPLPWQPHHDGHIGDTMGCDHPSFIQIGPLVGEFQHFAIWRPSAILNWNFAILDHPHSQLCGSITLSKFGVDPIFPAGDIAIL